MNNEETYLSGFRTSNQSGEKFRPIPLFSRSLHRRKLINMENEKDWLDVLHDVQVDCRANESDFRKMSMAFSLTGNNEMSEFF